MYICAHPFCLKKEHATTWSKKCRANPDYLKANGLEEQCAAAVAATAAEVPTAGVPVVAAVPDFQPPAFQQLHPL